jgi:hypothetical protein
MLNPSFFMRALPIACFAGHRDVIWNSLFLSGGSSSLPPLSTINRSTELMHIDEFYKSIRNYKYLFFMTESFFRQNHSIIIIAVLMILPVNDSVVYPEKVGIELANVNPVLSHNT